MMREFHVSLFILHLLFAVSPCVRALELAEDKLAILRRMHTDKYHDPAKREFEGYPAYAEELGDTLIVRRGNSFRVVPAETAVHVPPPGSDEYDLSWLQEQISTDGIVRLPEDMPIGEYHIDDFELIVLFNPYGCDKTGDKKIDNHLSEYVENKQGVVWTGSVLDHGGMLFYYEQFKIANLRTTLHLLQGLNAVHRASPVSVSRHLSHILMQDVCEGYWPEKDQAFYKKKDRDCYTCDKKAKPSINTCRAASDWESSTQIFEQYWARVTSGKSKTKVQYCQCFIFAALATTSGRTLGIPTRPVTCFRSAHDENFNRAIEEFYVVKGTQWTEPDESERDEACSQAAAYSPDSDPKGMNDEACPFPHESVWDFHAWTEMGMKRDRAKYSGWQVVDATHQEFSYHDKYENGPTPLAAIRKNEDTCYDAEFVITEVKADTILWLRKEDSSTWERYKSKSLYPDGRIKYLVDNPHNTPGSKLVTLAPGKMKDLEGAECSRKGSPCYKCLHESDCSKVEDDLTSAYKDTGAYKKQCAGSSRRACGPGAPSRNKLDSCDIVETTAFLELESADGPPPHKRRRLDGRHFRGESGVLEPSESVELFGDLSEDWEERADMDTMDEDITSTMDTMDEDMTSTMDTMDEDTTSTSGLSLHPESTETTMPPQCSDASLHSSDASNVIFSPVLLRAEDDSSTHLAFDTKWHASIDVINCASEARHISVNGKVHVKNYDGTPVIYKRLRDDRVVPSVVAHLGGSSVANKRINPGEILSFVMNLDLRRAELAKIGIDGGTARHIEINYFGSVVSPFDEFHHITEAVPLHGSASERSNLERFRPEL